MWALSVIPSVARDRYCTDTDGVDTQFTPGCAFEASVDPHFVRDFRRRRESAVRFF